MCDVGRVDVRASMLCGIHGVGGLFGLWVAPARILVWVTAVTASLNHVRGAHVWVNNVPACCCMACLHVAHNLFEHPSQPLLCLSSFILWPPVPFTSFDPSATQYQLRRTTAGCPTCLLVVGGPGIKRVGTHARWHMVGTLQEPGISTWRYVGAGEQMMACVGHRPLPVLLFLARACVLQLLVTVAARCHVIRMAQCIRACVCGGGVSRWRGHVGERVNGIDPLPPPSSPPPPWPWNCWLASPHNTSCVLCGIAAHTRLSWWTRQSECPLQPSG